MYFIRSNVLCLQGVKQVQHRVLLQKMAELMSCAGGATYTLKDAEQWTVQEFIDLHKVRVVECWVGKVCFGEIGGGGGRQRLLLVVAAKFYSHP